MLYEGKGAEGYGCVQQLILIRSPTWQATFLSRSEGLRGR